jgi:hypothetical protein
MSYLRTAMSAAVDSYAEFSNLMNAVSDLKKMTSSKIVVEKAREFLTIFEKLYGDYIDSHPDKKGKAVDMEKLFDKIIGDKLNHLDYMGLVATKCKAHSVTAKGNMNGFTIKLYYTFSIIILCEIAGEWKAEEEVGCYWSYNAVNLKTKMILNCKDGRKMGPEIWRDPNWQNPELHVVDHIFEKQRKCVVCGVASKQSCSVCGDAYYCSREHQKQDWKTHKTTCQKIAPVCKVIETYIDKYAPINGNKK